MAERKMVLNEGPVSGGTPGLDIAARLRHNLNQLKGDFFDLKRGRVDYAALEDSEAFATYAADTLQLQRFDPGLLATREERLAFWINLYNSLVVHGVIALGLRRSVREQPHFFRRVCYRIGGMLFSPDDIEHGILRGNRHPPHGLFHPFAETDARRAYVIDPPTHLIHFTLVCASASCPPINYYIAERLAEQLDVAAAGFVNGPEVEVRPRDNLLRLSPIFKWYRADFGGHEGVIDTLIRYLDHGENKDFLLERGMGADVEWKAYDWSLNR